MAMATASPIIAAVLTAPPGQSSLLSRRACTLAYNPSFYSTASPRAFSGPRPTALVALIAFPSLRRSGVRLPAAESDAREIEVETASGGDGGSPEGSDPGSGGGAGGDNGKSGGGDSEKSEGGGADEGKKRDHKGGMSMSQKLTMGYAALVGAGGIMGYVKSGSQKSLAAGGIAALLLCYVYTLLPVRPVFASSMGLGLSAALLAVMGSRFKKSGKIFPAGVVSLVSLVMVGGYFHGILRSSHV